MSATPHSDFPRCTFAERLKVFMRISCRARSLDPLSWWVDGSDPASRRSSSSSIDGTAHTPLSSHIPMHSWHNPTIAATLPGHHSPLHSSRRTFLGCHVGELSGITRKGFWLSLTALQEQVIYPESVCVRERREGRQRLTGRGVPAGARVAEGRKSERKKRGGLKWIVNSNALITVKAVDKEHLQTPTRNTLGPAKGHLALSDACRLSATLFRSLWRQLS